VSARTTGRPREAAAPPAHAEAIAALELSRLQSMENDRLRSQLTATQDRMSHNEALAARLAADLAAERTRADTLQTLMEQLQVEREQFRQSIERLQHQADAARRDALLRIDQLHSETREAQAESRALRERLEQAHKDLHAEREFSALLRQQLGQRARQEREP